MPRKKAKGGTDLLSADAVVLAPGTSLADALLDAMGPEYEQHIGVVTEMGYSPNTMDGPEVYPQLTVRWDNGKEVTFRPPHMPEVWEMFKLAALWHRRILVIVRKGQPNWQWCNSPYNAIHVLES